MKPLDTLLSKTRRVENDDLRQLFLDARTHNVWLNQRANQVSWAVDL